MHDHLLLQIAIMLAAAKIGGELCERYLKQPAVLGELLFGIAVGYFGWVQTENMTLFHLAEIGAVLLLFEIGLESDIEELFKVGFAALWVAVAGVVLPFAFGYGVAHAMGRTVMEAIFVGAALTATSVGITARVFADLGALHTREAKIVLGAAVADDVIGLIILAAVSGLAEQHSVSFAAIIKTTLIALLFLIGAIAIGMRATPFLLRQVRRMRTRAAVSSAAVVFCLLLATMAEMAGLAAIVGAFAAGLVLDKADDKLHIEEKVKSIADIFVPIFFVMTGARINLLMFNPVTTAGRATLILGGLLFVVAVIGKVIGGMTVPGKGLNRVTVGVGMIPRGEVGIIFATMGLTHKVIDQALYAAIIFVVAVTTFVTPPLLKITAGRGDAGEPDSQLHTDTPTEAVVVRQETLAETT